MTKQEIQRAMALVQSNAMPLGYTDRAFAVGEQIHRAAAEGRKAHITLYDAACLLGYQTVCLDGTIDAKLLDETAEWMKHGATIVG